MQPAPSDAENPTDAAHPSQRRGEAGPGREDLARLLRIAFLEQGYAQAGIDSLAKACGVARRDLQPHAVSKDEAFRFMLQVGSETTTTQALAAGRAILAQGAGPAEIFFLILDKRYGDARRELAESFHAREIDEQAERRAKDILVEDAIRFQAQLADLIREMGRRGLMELHATVSPAVLARMLCESARGATQSLPPFPLSQLADHYRKIVAAILYGSAHAPGH